MVLLPEVTLLLPPSIPLLFHVWIHPLHCLTRYLYSGIWISLGTCVLEPMVPHKLHTISSISNLSLCHRPTKFSLAIPIEKVFCLCLLLGSFS